MNKDVETIGQQLTPHNPIFDSPYIKTIHDNSSDYSNIEQQMKDLGLGLDFTSLSVARMLIVFNNNCHLSVIRGEMTYGGSQGLYEIAVFHPEKGMTGEYFEGRDKGEKVLGHCKIEDVQNFINKIGKLPTTNSVPIETKLVSNQNDSI